MATGVQTCAHILDPRGAFKAPHLSGKREDFETWAFQFESNAGLLGWTSFLESVKELASEIDETHMADAAVAVSKQLYHLLVTIVKGPALSVVRLTPR